MADKKGVSLSVGRGEKQSVKQGAGLTAKGRAKYNRQTGSNSRHLPPTLRRRRTKAVRSRFVPVCVALWPRPRGQQQGLGHR